MLAAALLDLCGRFPSFRCVCLAGWPRPSVSSYGGGIISPRGWRCPLPAFAPRFGRFPPFWRPFGVAVVSNAGAVSVRPFRWCRCACKVAIPRGLALPLSLTPSDISPSNHNGNNTPPHGRAVRILAPPPLCVCLRAACCWC